MSPCCTPACLSRTLLLLRSLKCSGVLDTSCVPEVQHVRESNTDQVDTNAHAHQLLIFRDCDILPWHIQVRTDLLPESAYSSTSINLYALQAISANIL